MRECEKQKKELINVEVRRDIVLSMVSPLSCAQEQSSKAGARKKKGSNRLKLFPRGSAGLFLRECEKQQRELINVEVRRDIVVSIVSPLSCAQEQSSKAGASMKKGPIRLKLFPGGNVEWFLRECEKLILRECEKQQRESIIVEVQVYIVVSICFSLIVCQGTESAS